jgi:hypothetical protein
LVRERGSTGITGASKDDFEID